MFKLATASVDVSDNELYENINALKGHKMKSQQLSFALPSVCNY